MRIGMTWNRTNASAPPHVNASLVALALACGPLLGACGETSGPEPGPEPPLYEVVDLGTLGGDRSRAQAINDHGQVTGYAERADGVVAAFLWEDGGMRELTGLSAGVGINRSGEVIGLVGGSSQSHAGVWRDGAAVDLGTLAGHDASDALAINDDGWILGTSVLVTFPEETPHAVLWTDAPDGAPMDLGDTLRLTALNDDGVAAGCVRHAGLSCGPAVLWQDGVATTLDIEPAADAVVDISDQGAVLGYLHTGVAFLWDAGTVTELTYEGASGVHVGALNGAGDVVGDVWVDGVHTAVLWRDGEAVDLGAMAREQLGEEAVPGSMALDINDAGYIVGARLIAPGHARALLWIPR